MGGKMLRCVDFSCGRERSGILQSLYLNQWADIAAIGLKCPECQRTAPTEIAGSSSLVVRISDHTVISLDDDDDDC